MDNIGRRTAQAIRDRAKQNGTSIRKECKRINASPQNFHNWETSGTHPTSYFLREMVLAGYDVIYILTGKEN